MRILLDLDVSFLSGWERRVLLGVLVFGVGRNVKRVFLGLDDGDVVGQRALRSDLAGGVPWQHDLDLDAQHSLAQQNVTSGCVDVVVAWISGVDHQTVDELHRLCALTAQLARHDHFASLGTRLHDETEHAITGTTDGQTSDELVAERLGLRDGAETAGGDFLGVQFNCSRREVESKRILSLVPAAAVKSNPLTSFGQRRSTRGCDVPSLPERSAFWWP